MKNEKNSPEEKPARKAAGTHKKSSATKTSRSSAPDGAAKSKAAAASASDGAAIRSVRPSTADLHEEIRLRAYQIYCERGGQHGMHDADWHRAELEVRAKYDK